MPYKNNQRGGSLILDRTFKGVGRIQRATGVTRLEDYELISSMLTELSRSGKHEILRDIRDGKVTLVEVYGYYHEGQLEQTPSAFTLKTIEPTITDWIEGRHNLAESTKKNYKGQFNVFVRVVGKNTQISDLPTKLKVYKQYCQKRDTLRSANYVRSILQSFLNNTVGRHHSLWKQVSNIKPFTLANQRQAPQLTVVEAKELIESLQPIEHAKIAEAMLFTGMSWSEVNGEWWEENDRVSIKGTKRKGRVRIVPLIQPNLSRPRRKIKAFRIALKKVREDITTHSFRRTFADWMSDAGIPRIRRIMYMGHGNTDMTDRYERAQVAAFLREDAELIRAFIFKMWQERKAEKDETVVTPIHILTPQNKTTPSKRAMNRAFEFLYEEMKPEHER
jgi:integrase